MQPVGRFLTLRLRHRESNDLHGINEAQLLCEYYSRARGVLKQPKLGDDGDRHLAE